MSEAFRLKADQIGIIRTDTLYGIVASALNEGAVKRVYTVKGRTPNKPCIILISSPADLTLFGIETSAKRLQMLSKYWPGPVSIILPCGKDVPEYLHRATHTLAFRMPDDEKLRTLLAETGPLIAPSANPEGLPPAKTVEEAKKYFGAGVDFYIDGGASTAQASTLIQLTADDSVVVLRRGGVLISPTEESHSL